MTSAISFTVPGEPVAFARTRGEARFTPAPQRAWMASCGMLARSAMRGRALFVGPVQVDVRAVFPWPVSWSAKQRVAAIFKTSVPDSDNLLKLVLDSLKGIVWRDDAQAARVSAEKVYGTEPHVLVTVTPLDTTTPSSLES